MVGMSPSKRSQPVLQSTNTWSCAYWEVHPQVGIARLPKLGRQNMESVFPILVVSHGAGLHVIPLVHRAGLGGSVRSLFSACISWS